MIARHRPARLPLRASPATLLLLSSLHASACTAEDDACAVTSTHPRFLPDCDDARLVFHDAETRFALAGTDPQGGSAAVVAYLPAGASEGTYGGTTGNYLALLLELDDAELGPNNRTTTLTIGVLESGTAEIGISAEFDDGDISGALMVPVVDGR